MARDEAHGGDDWGFRQSLWSPSRKTNGARWAFWESLLDVEVGDSVLHLRSKGKDAAFVGFSVAATNGFATQNRPPDPGEWSYADTYYRVLLKYFTSLNSPIPLREIFGERDNELRTYYLNNRNIVREKERLFFVTQSGRLQCLNGAYLSQASTELARLLLNQPIYIQQQKHDLLQEVSTGEQLRTLISRIGQNEFSKRVRENYSMRCCFPDCDVEEHSFLRGAHIARWADVSKLRGDISNGLCLCLMHDQAFERGLFTVDHELQVWVDPDKAYLSSWSKAHLLPHHKSKIRLGDVLLSKETLQEHWKRTGCYPM